ncbi:hypothetical protein BC826DRAFT_1054657 [Russula brevipes]|nr:hypothetical protein BC826DRAFT_1054657 [Russula brevipes]
MHSALIVVYACCFPLEAFQTKPSSTNSTCPTSPPSSLQRQRLCRSGSLDLIIYLVGVGRPSSVAGPNPVA